MAPYATIAGLVVTIIRESKRKKLFAVSRASICNQ